MNFSLPIYSFTIKKYLKAKSTWIITIFSAFVVAFLLGTLLPLATMSKDTTAPAYAVTINTMVSMVMTFLALFSAIFAGFKAASMYKDEVEEGTFLVVLSKPITRSNVIFQKWLALFTLIFFYSLINAIFFTIGVALFDKGGKSVVLANGFEPLRSRIGLVAFYIFLILFVVGLIFASIGIIISTKLSVSATVGISIALGIVIPITGLVQAFTQRPEQKSIANAQFAVNSELVKLAQNTPGVDATVFDNLQKDVDKYRIYDLAAATGKNDIFKIFWFLDVSYQIKNMSTLATNATLSETAKKLVNASQANQTTNKRYKVDDTTKIQNAFDMVSSLMADFDAPSGVQKFSPRDMGSSFALAQLQKTINDHSGSASKEKAIVPKSLLTNLTTVNSDPNSPAFPALDTFIQAVNNSSTGTSGKTMTPNDLVVLINDLFSFDDAKHYHFNNLLSNASTSQPNTFVKQTAVFEDVFKEGGLLDSLASSSSTFEKALNSFHDAIKEQESPLTGLLFSKENLLNLKLNANTNYNTWLSAGTNQDEYDKLTDSLTIDDQSFVRNLLMASAEDEIKVVTGKPYVAPGVLLAIYAILALILVPATYLVMRRQDFR